MGVIIFGLVLLGLFILGVYLIFKTLFLISEKITRKYNLQNAKHPWLD